MLMQAFISLPSSAFFDQCASNRETHFNFHGGCLTTGRDPRGRRIASNFLQSRRRPQFRICAKSTDKFIVRRPPRLFSTLPKPGNDVGMSPKALEKSSEVPSFMDEYCHGEEGLWSVIIPTYNRLPILKKCLKAFEEQTDYWVSGIKDFEVILVDDGSSDGTVEFLLNSEGQPGEGTAIASKDFPHVKVLQQQHGGASKARNLGIMHSRGSVIVFVDSDLVVTSVFLREHGRALYNCFRKEGDDRTFTYGRVINTNNFEEPHSEPFKITDISTAFFATGNVAISRKRLIEAANMLGELTDGPFDSNFSDYGWEDLELGVRLKQRGAQIKHVPAAVGYHWHPTFSCDHLPMRIEQERQRGRNGAYFYCKHPYLSVRFMVQMTPIHQIFWFLLTLGGLMNEKSLGLIIKTLVAWGQPQIAEALTSPILNWHTVQAAKEEIRKLRHKDY